MSLEWFYTLPNNLELHRVSWKIELRLRDRIISLCQIVQPVRYMVRDPREAAIARYLFEQLQQYPEAKEWQAHWIAFLYKRCEMVCHRILPWIGTESTISFERLFQMASEEVINPANFYRKFDDSHVQLGYWYPTLIRFTDIRIKRLLFHKLRKETGNNMWGNTNLGLAARSSRSRVKEALKRCHYSENEISQYLLGWDCFQEYRQSVKQRVDRFQQRDFQNIAQLYNELREQFNFSAVSHSEIRNWLNDIGEAIRRFLDPPANFFRTRIYSFSGTERDASENIPFEAKQDEKMCNTARALGKAIAKFLAKEFQKIEAQQTLVLRYGLELTQPEVAKELGKNQSTISRRLEGFNKKILNQIVDWLKQYAKIQPSATALNEIEAVLYQHYSQKIDRLIKKIIRSLDNQSWELLKLYYVVRKPLSEIGKMIHKSEPEVSERLDEIKQCLSHQIANQIQQKFELNLELGSVAHQKIYAIVANQERLATICNCLANQRQQQPVLQ